MTGLELMCIGSMGIVIFSMGFFIGLATGVIGKW